MRAYVWSVDRWLFVGFVVVTARTRRAAAEYLAACYGARRVRIGRFLYEENAA